LDFGFLQRAANHCIAKDLSAITIEITGHLPKAKREYHYFIHNKSEILF